MASNQVRVTSTYRDGIGPGLQKNRAEASLLASHFGKLGSAASVGFGKVEKGVGAVTGAMRHAKGEVTNLASGFGLLAGGAALGGLGEVLVHSVEKTNEFGRSVYLLGKLTNTAAEPMSALLATFEKYGVESEAVAKSLGFLEKNVGNLALSTKAETKFTHDFGFALRDTGGHLKDANQLVLQAADYFTNKHIPATQKAALEAKLFGRGWQSMLPVLALGSKGILEAEASAKELGLTLNEQNVHELADYRKSTRELGEAWGGLQLQIGETIIPALKDVADTMRKTLANPETRGQIVGFFKEGVKFAQGFGGAIQNDLVPAVKAIAGAWDSIPGPMKDILIKGFVAGKVTKFLFDFGPLDIAKALKGGLGGLLGRGGTPATPMFTKDVGGLGGGAAAAGGAGGKLGTIAKFAAALGLATVAVDLYTTQLAPLNDFIAQQGKDIKENTNASFKSATLNDLQSELAATVDGFNQLNAIGPLSDFLYGDQKKALEENILAIQAEIDARKKGTTTFLDMSKAGRDTDKLGAWPDLGKVEHSVSALDKDTQHNLQALIHATKDASIRKYADKLAHDVAKGAGNTANTAKYVQELKAKLKEVHDPKTKVALEADLRKVEGKLPNRNWVDKELAHASKIEASTASAKTKIAQLRDIQADLKARGDTHAASTISKAIDALKPHIDATTIAVRNIETLGGSSSGLHASGGLWMTNGPTRIGARDIAGEAGGEAIAIISRPRPLAAPAQAGGMLTAVPVPVPSNWTPAQQRAFADEAAPHIARWMQQNGLMHRAGTGMRG